MCFDIDVRGKKRFNPKQEIDDIVMDTISASQNAATEDSDDNEENGTDKSESDDTYEPKSNKRGKSSKNANKRKKKGSSDEDDDGDADEAAKKKIPPPAPAAPPKKKNAGYTREYTLSPTLAEVVGAKQMPRHLVVKKIWEIVKTRDLRDPKDKRFTICDQQLLSVFGVKRFQTFSMMKYLKNHFIEPQ